MEYIVEEEEGSPDPQVVVIMAILNQVSTELVNQVLNVYCSTKC